MSKKEKWEVNYKEGVIQVGPKGKPDIVWVTDEANAKRIVQCVNNFDELLEACKYLLSLCELEDEHGRLVIKNDAKKDAKQAIKKAEPNE